uniref:Uncharacterized protein n=1 Tax=Anguilla anguilla TaxID=7936 RepID=A0A0E9V654_ANGAN
MKGFSWWLSGEATSIRHVTGKKLFIELKGFQNLSEQLFTEKYLPTSQPIFSPVQYPRSRMERETASICR